MSIDYKQAGVDVEQGESLVEWLKSEAPQEVSHKHRLVQGIGGFAALFRAGFPEMKSPCLVSCTDGVGTKLKWAVEFSRYESIAQDLVAMCVNDMICSGARPLFFLDYFACGKLEFEAAQPFLRGLRNACTASDCLLIGGETAEMPGVYQGKDFDCAGFSVGVVDEESVLGAHRVKPGMKVIGVGSSGFHSNGYSLLRRLFEKDAQDYIDELMAPTHLYVKLLEALKKAGEIHAIAHITGGGLDNLNRILPAGVQAQIDLWSWTELTQEVQKRSQLSTKEMLKTFNCGIGMMLVVDFNSEKTMKTVIEQEGFSYFDVGELVFSEKKDAPADWVLQ